MCLLEWDLFLQWWKGVEWRIPRSKDWPLIKAGIYDHHRNGAESFGSPLKRKQNSVNHWPSVVLVLGTETIVKFWYWSRNFFFANSFFFRFSFQTYSQFPLSFQLPKKIWILFFWKAWIWTHIYKNNLKVSNRQEIWF